MRKNYYSMTQSGNSATINIYGDITSFPWFEGDVSANNLSKQLEELSDVTEINVYINSYGGEVAEGLAIYNALKRHKAKIKTYCDGFACSIASVIFMAGEERIMPKSSFLMIHNAWGGMCGNADEMRKYADDLETVTQASVEIYKANSNLEEDKIKSLMDAETILTAEEAFEFGFATRLEDEEKDGTKQSGTRWLYEIIKKYRAELTEEDEEEGEEMPEEVEPPEDEETVEENEGEETDPETESDNPETPPDDEDEETPKDEENTEDEETEDTPTDEEEAAQKWCGIFSALKKL